MVDKRKFKNQSYIQRLTQLRFTDEGLEFDYTARNIQELISEKPKWGIDSRGKIFDFTKPKNWYNIEYRQVVKLSGPYIWLNHISYPFRISDYLIDSSKIEQMWVGTVKIGNKIVIHDFSMFKKDGEKLFL